MPGVHPRRRYYHLGVARMTPPPQDYLEAPEAEAVVVAASGAPAAEEAAAAVGTSAEVAPACSRRSSRILLAEEATQLRSDVDPIDPARSPRCVTSPSSAAASVAAVVTAASCDTPALDDPDGPQRAPISYRPFSNFESFSAFATRKHARSGLGGPPPLPKYIENVERNNHFIQPEGAADFTPHLRMRPNFSFRPSESPAPNLKFTRPLLEWRVASAGGDGERSLSRVAIRDRPRSAAARSGGTMSPDWTIEVTAAGNTPGSDRWQQPQQQQRRPRTAAASVGATGASQAHRRWTTTSQQSDARARRQRPGSAATTTFASFTATTSTKKNSSPPAAAVAATRHRSSLDVVRCGSASFATRRLREQRIAAQSAHQLATLVEHEHPNQVYVYV